MFKTMVSTFKRDAKWTWGALAVCALLLSGCASSNVKNMAQYRAEPLTRPDAIYVYTFDVEPEHVKVDSGILARLGTRIGQKSTSAEQAALAVQTQEAVANEVVLRLQSMGLRAMRSSVPAPRDQNVLLVTGRFEKVDSGNGTRRTVVGLGAGKSQVGATVQIWSQPAGRAPQLLETYDVSADSGHMPGMAETMGVGAATNRLAVSAATGGVLHTTSETLHAKPVDDAQRMADSIAKQIAQRGVAQGWLTKG
jgi:hypothetical protein